MTRFTSRPSRRAWRIIASRSRRRSGSPPVNEKKGICASRLKTSMTRFASREGHGGRTRGRRPARTPSRAAAGVAEPAGVVARVGDRDLPEDGQAREVEGVRAHARPTRARRAPRSRPGRNRAGRSRTRAPRGRARRRRCRGARAIGLPDSRWPTMRRPPSFSRNTWFGGRIRTPSSARTNTWSRTSAEEAVDPGEVADRDVRAGRRLRQCAPPRHARGVAGRVARGMARGVAGVVAGGVARVVAGRVAGLHAAGLRLRRARSSP